MKQMKSALIVVCALVGVNAIGGYNVRATGATIGKIMPLGDSITYGGSGINAGYRGALYDALTTGGATFQFVGDSTLNPGSLPVDQRQHAGHSSYTTYDIKNNLDGVDDARYKEFGGADRDPHGGYWLTGGHGTGRDAIAPDFILLLVGANDLYYNEDANAQTNLRDLLGALTTLAPNANVLIADIPPSSYGTARTNNWNSAISSEVAYFQNLNKHVTCVDMNTNFPSDGLSGDGVHPNDIGYAWMAGQWNDAIMALAVPEPSCFAILVIGLTSVLAYVWHRRRQQKRTLNTRY